MIVGPHSTKLPHSWDTESDQLSLMTDGVNVLATLHFYRLLQDGSGLHMRALDFGLKDL